MNRIILSLGAILIGILFLGVSTIAEEITLTTYYPAPYGAYNELTTTGNTYLATTSGRVGIGTTNPNETLEVVGKIRANTAFNLNGDDGDSDTFDVVTDMRIIGPNLQAQKRTIIVSGGIVTDIGNARWEDIGSVNP